MQTYQDYLSAADRGAFIKLAIEEHTAGELYKTAVSANLYDRQRNETINNYVRMIQGSTHNPIVDITAANNRIASNFFHRLNTQRCSYLLGNGVNFKDKATRDKLGVKFDQDLNDWAYKALIHGVAFGFWNHDRLQVFPVTEFVPLWDEDTGALEAGIRFWSNGEKKPDVAMLFTSEGITRYVRPPEDKSTYVRDGDEDEPYITNFEYTEAGGAMVVGTEDYGHLPIVPMWGSQLRQSTLVGMREKIDSYDLIQSGFANDLSDCAQIYWLIENCGGMTDEDLQEFLSNIRLNHVAKVDTNSFDGSTRAALSPYVQDVPYQGRKAYLDGMRASIYEDFGALDVHMIHASSTNDHIDAAYQPLDEEADQFELQVVEAVQRLLSLLGIDDTPIFKRNRISNVKEQIEAVMLEAKYLDDIAVRQLLPNITVDMQEAIQARLIDAEAGRMTLYTSDNRKALRGPSEAVEEPPADVLSEVAP